MFTNIDTGRLSGFLFIFILVTTIASRGFAGALEQEKTSQILESVARSEQKFRVSIALDLLSHVSIIALAAMLYSTFSPYNRPLALLGTLWRVAEGIVIALSEINFLLLIPLAQKYIATTGAAAAPSSEAGTLETIGRTLIHSEQWGNKLALGFLALGSLLFAILFVTSAGVPKGIAWWGVIASALAFISIVVSLINPAAPVLVRELIFLPMIPYEITLGVWLLLRGVRLPVP